MIPWLRPCSESASTCCRWRGWRGSSTRTRASSRRSSRTCELRLLPGQAPRDEHLAARFAAKEAVLKAFGHRPRAADALDRRRDRERASRAGRACELHGEVAALGAAPRARRTRRLARAHRRACAGAGARGLGGLGVRFHLIDRIDACEPAPLRARRASSPRCSEDYWEDSGAGLVMPPPLVLEALCQAGTWLIMITHRAAQAGRAAVDRRRSTSWATCARATCWSSRAASSR